MLCRECKAAGQREEADMRSTTGKIDLCYYHSAAEDGIDFERAVIVKWLRMQDALPPEFWADAIEAGEHRK